MGDELVVLVTAPNAEEARRIAQALVAEHLAACANLIPGIESIYRWEGKVQRDTEVLLVLKTVAASYEALERRVKELHSYSTPEVIALSIDRGSAAYLKWLAESTSST